MKPLRHHSHNTSLPVTFCLFTSTLGHFGQKDRYIKTLNSFSRAIDLRNYEKRLAHIKISPGDELLAREMADILFSKFNFEVISTVGNWKHGDESHQGEYIKDAIKMYSYVDTPYVQHSEDDWEIKCYDGRFFDYIERAIGLFEGDSDLMQVRIPRYSNEMDRINDLPRKHGLNRSCFKVDEFHFRHNDFSANPAFYRTRDIRAAMILTTKLGLSLHIEHAGSAALGALSQKPGSEFACFNPEKIRIGHIGCLPGEEDDLTKPLNCD